MIVHTLLPDGGFVAGDTETGRTSYAYPTSTHATMARFRPNKVAAEMAREANAFRPTTGHAAIICADYDAGNWKRLPSVSEMSATVTTDQGN